MGKRDYERLDILKFGRHLIESEDLDPVYCALNKMELPHDQLCRWLIAYWCLYHCGAASYLSELEGSNFWRGLLMAAHNEEPTPIGGRWPRGHERRHFRGLAATKAVRVLHERYGEAPEAMVDYIAEAAPSYEAVAQRAQEHPLFGPWISFKIADMVERVLGCKVDFDQAAVFMFKDPVKAALILWRQKMGLSEYVKPKREDLAIQSVVNYLTGEFKDMMAPPLYDRAIGLQEVETVLCKWKSHLNGHYPLENDLWEISTGLQEWHDSCKTARSMFSAMPPVNMEVVKS